MPIWITDNFANTVRRFDRFINIQASEATVLMLRKWSGNMVSGTATSFVNNTYYSCYEFNLYVPTVPPTGGKPRLSSLNVYLDGSIMTPVSSFNDLSSDSQFTVEVEKAGPKSSSSYGTIVIVLNPGFVPTGHTITYRYEESCHCIESSEESWHPIATCTTCWGTGFIGGYNQYTCEQQVECGRVIRPANTILVRYPLAQEAVKVSRYGFEVLTQRKSWSTVPPLVHDWDMLIRLRAYGAPYNIDPTTLAVPSERYFIVDWFGSSFRPSYDLPLKSQPGTAAVERGTLLHQKFDISEINSQHPIYSLGYTL